MCCIPQYTLGRLKRLGRLTRLGRLKRLERLKRVGWLEPHRRAGTAGRPSARHLEVPPWEASLARFLRRLTEDGFKLREVFGVVAQPCLNQR